MTGNRYTGRAKRPAPEPKFGRMLLVSLALHLFVLVLFTGLPSSTDPLRRPVYYVDLSRLPVADPQAGRPDARPKEDVKKSTPAAKPTAVKIPTTDPQPKPAPKPSPTAKAKPTPVKTGPSDADIAKKMAEMRVRQQQQDERQALKDKLAALAAADTRGADAGPVAPLGMPEAKGKEAGVSQLTWLQAYLKAQWSLSRYQVRRADLEATVRLVYNDKGRMIDLKFTKESGDGVFDDSVRAAVLKASQLEFTPPVSRWEVDVVFNLKELLNEKR